MLWESCPGEPALFTDGRQPQERGRLRLCGRLRSEHFLPWTHLSDESQIPGPWRPVGHQICAGSQVVSSPGYVGDTLDGLCEQHEAAASGTSFSGWPVLRDFMSRALPGDP